MKVSVYFFIFALCAKGVHYYANNHPTKDELLHITGTVTEVRLGGQGRATKLEVKSSYGTHIYSSYYGKVWPGMERIKTGDKVYILAERNKFNKNELFSGKSYYIWELKHQGQIIINYNDVIKFVGEKEAMVNRYINYWLVISFFFLMYALVRRDLQISRK